jgi:hypothetical protein
MKRGFAAQFGERFTRRLFGWQKIPIPASPESGIYASLQQATGYFGIFTTAHQLWYRTFALKRILYFI